MKALLFIVGYLALGAFAVFRTGHAQESMEISEILAKQDDWRVVEASCTLSEGMKCRMVSGNYTIQIQGELKRGRNPGWLQAEIRHGIAGTQGQFRGQTITIDENSELDKNLTMVVRKDLDRMYNEQLRMLSTFEGAKRAFVILEDRDTTSWEESKKIEKLEAVFRRH